MPTFTLEDDLALARVAIAQADLVSLARFRAQDLVITTKPDRTPVIRDNVLRYDGGRVCAHFQIDWS